MIGAERALFSASLGMIVDLLSDGDLDLGVPAFDQLQRGQKFFALYQAARGLLRPDEPAPQLTAYLEATVATVFQFMLDQILQEISDPDFADDPQYWRELALLAAAEVMDQDELPTPNCDDASEWELVIESLEGAVLWDRDFEMQFLMDVDSESAKKLKADLDIDGDFYTAIPDEVPDKQIKLYRDALMGLTPEGRA